MNAVSPGYPYLSGVIHNIHDDVVEVLFPFMKRQNIYKYPISSIQPFKTQFPGGKFCPIKASNKKSISKIVKDYENKLNQYLSTQ